jgi:hypothetical protein
VTLPADQLEIFPMSQDDMPFEVLPDVHDFDQPFLWDELLDYEHASWWSLGF